MTKQMIAAMALAASLGAAGSAGVLSLVQAGAKSQYRVHGVDIRTAGPIQPDGGQAVGITAYAGRQLPDGGFKDVGGHRCSPDRALDDLARTFVLATASCVHED